MQIGMTGYITLRSDLFEPADNPLRFFPLITAAPDIIGSHIHWFPTRGISKPDSDKPLSTATEDEKEAHRMAIHYGDCFKELNTYTLRSPSKGRRLWLEANPFDFNTMKYQIPQLDALFVFASGQINGAWVVNQIMQACWRANPNIGFVIMDQDLSVQTTISKMRFWHPNWQERTIILAEHNKKRRNMRAQAVAYCPHLHYRCRQPQSDNGMIAYVGNDYDRRPAMREFFRTDRLHWWGKIDPKFMAEEVNQWECSYHGPYKSKTGWTIEDVYAACGTGINISRELYYRNNCVTPRTSEISRAGCPSLMHSKFAMAKALVGEHCVFSDLNDMLTKHDLLMSQPQFRADTVHWQQQNLNHWLGIDRWIDAWYSAAKRLYAGPITEPWYYNPYADLCEVSGISEWV